MKLDAKYVGVPFVSGGRDYNGADCWGLARLFYRDELSIDLPSFDDQYYVSEAQRLQDLIAQYKEGWERVKVPEYGDLILFRVLGTESHIGIYIGEGKFLHSMEKPGSAIQSLDNREWTSRTVGFFKFKENTGAALNAVPHPLRTERFTTAIPAGTTVEELAGWIQKEYDISPELKQKVVIFVNGRIIKKEEWAKTVLQNTDKVEYRAVPENDVLRIVLLIVVAIVAPYVAGYFGAVGTTAYSVALVAVNVAGALLINAIAPIRPPKPKEDPGQAKGQLLLNGGSNQPNKYGAIPVVLGRVRMTAPAAANMYSNTSTDTSDLKVLLTWGFGPLSISDIRIGGTAIENYIHSKRTYYGTASETLTDKANVEYLYSGGKDIEQVYKGITLSSDGTDAGSIWLSQAFVQTCTSLDVTLHFPQGLRAVMTKGKTAGDVSAALFRGRVEYRRLDTVTGAPVTPWVDPSENWYQPSAWATTISAPMITVAEDSGSWYNYKVVNTTYRYYQWYTFGIGPGGIYMYAGSPSQNQYQEPDSHTISVLQRSGYGGGYSNYRLKAILPAGVLPLANVCVYKTYGTGHEDSWPYYADHIVAIEHTRITGSLYSYVGLDLDATVTSGFLIGGFGGRIPNNRVGFSAGSVQRLTNAFSISLGGPGEPFYLRKDAFSYTVPQWSVPEGRYEVRVRRLNSDFTNPGDYQLYHEALFHTTTAYANRSPVNFPPNCKLALTGLNIRATDQLNGQIEGINALVCTIALDWTRNPTVTGGGDWVLRETNNPASLFRYVLEHPANAQRLTGSGVSINLPELQVWHDYCVEKGFRFNDVVAEQRSILEVLRDICAAGRASPVLRDGKWTVVIDKPRDNAVQHFTPHNSWNFESTKNLPRQPDAFRVRYIDEALNYQENELTVYNEGKNESNAELFEEIQLPGVTKMSSVFAHARWHLAQLKLRPEVYTLNTDMEYLVCNRGDLVRVGHDVPMWGVATGRIVERIDSTTLRLDESMPLEVGKTYTIRIRLADGSSVTRTVNTSISGYYDTITLNAAVSELEGEKGNLIMLGELNTETQELIVISIEPAANGNARLTLVDYSPEMYNIDFSTNYQLPAYNSNITRTADNLLTSITIAPIFSQILSDESVLTVLSPGTFAINLVATLAPESGVSATYYGIEAQAQLANDSSDVWAMRSTTPSPGTSVKFTDVIEGEEYQLRARYVAIDGRTGPWSVVENHVVVGKTTPPGTPTNFEFEILAADGLLQFNWVANEEPDFLGYELRDTPTGWGDTNYLWQGSTTKTDVAAPMADVTKIYYLRAFDYNRNYSLDSAQVTFTTPKPGSVTNIQYHFGTTSNTNSTVTITWDAPLAQLIHTREYRLLIVKPDQPDLTVTVNGTSYIMPADWLGDATVSIITIDNVNNESIPSTVSIPKAIPNPVVNVRTEVVDNNVFIRWGFGALTTLPIAHVLVKRGPSWTAPDRIIGDKDGSFTSIFELTAGTNTYWLAAVDTDGRESVPVSVAATVSQPPDFVFNGEYTSLLGGTLVNAAHIPNSTSLLMLVNTTETWTQHFTTNSWASPSAQVSAGFPIYAQPGVTTASYQEVFALGTTLASSSITVSYTGSAVTGTPTVYSTIETRLGAGPWSTPAVGTSLFTTNFTDIRITIYAERNAPGNLYQLDNLNVRLDSKQITDGNSVMALSTDAAGTIVNFAKEFIDVSGINLTPSGTTPLSASYVFLDTVIDGTYNIVSNVATISVVGHQLEEGQNVRLSFTSGTAPSGVYQIVDKLSADSYTVEIETADTSGSVSTYPESMRVYVYDNEGTRMSCPVSWSARGY